MPAYNRGNLFFALAILLLAVGIINQSGLATLAGVILLLSSLHSLWRGLFNFMADRFWQPKDRVRPELDDEMLSKLDYDREKKN